jgi:hypothetical protein
VEEATGSGVENGLLLFTNFRRRSRDLKISDGVPRIYFDILSPRVSVPNGAAMFWQPNCRHKLMAPGRYRLLRNPEMEILGWQWYLIRWLFAAHAVGAVWGYRRLSVTSDPARPDSGHPSSSRSRKLIPARRFVDGLQVDAPREPDRL